MRKGVLSAFVISVLKPGRCRMKPTASLCSIIHGSKTFIASDHFNWISGAMKVFFICTGDVGKEYTVWTNNGNSLKKHCLPNSKAV